MNGISTSAGFTCTLENDNSAHVILINFPNDNTNRLWMRNCCNKDLKMKSNDKLHLNYYICYNYKEDCCYISKIDAAAVSEQDATLMCKTQIPLETDNVPDAFSTKAQAEVTYDIALMYCNTNTDINQCQYASVQVSDLCRICGESALDGIGIHTAKGLEVQLKDKINLHMPILVDQKDTIMPQKVCIGCYDKLDSVHSLTVTCLRTDMKLRKLLKVTQKSEYTSKCGNSMRECWLKLAEEMQREANTHHNTSQSPVQKSASRNGSVNSVGNTILTTPVKNTVYNSILVHNADSNAIDVTTGIAGVDNETRRIEKMLSKNEVSASAQESVALMENQQIQLKNDEGTVEAEQEITTMIQQSSAPDNVMPDAHELSDLSHSHRICFIDDGPASIDDRKEIIENAEASLNTRCGHCQVIYSTGRDLASHVAKCHDGVFKCSACNRTYEKWSSLDIHVATHGADRPYLCDLCGKGFKHSNNLRGHKRTHLDESRKKRHVCEQCGSGFRSRFHLREHTHQHEGTKPYACEECGKAFCKRIQLRQHKLSHGSKKYACPLCGVAFNRRGNMSAHLKRHVHGDGVYTCSVCAHKCDTMSELKLHRKNHTDADIVRNIKEKSTKKAIWQCQICSRVFSKRSVLEHHGERVHATAEEGPGSVECNECGKKLASKSSLMYHRKSVHLNLRAHVCQHCGKDFVSRESRLIHERLHTGERPYVCEVCNARYRCSSILSQHMKVHSNVKPYECHYCGKGFTRKSALDVHERTHTGVKPFSCQVCGTSFCQKGDMLKHLKTHSSKQFRCEQCDETFQVKKDLLTHVRDLHIGTLTDNSVHDIN